ncbi:MAG: T9SS type A sorting domain-containing protein [Bacteroidetes bacterium]|nr:MAG: T9SS type A sorting domain-containing protein [Bacteroidota bacterium]
MKKIYLLTALLFAGMCANAQFYQHTYGTTNGEGRGQGVNTFATGQGHIVAAPTWNTSTTTQDILVVNTDVNGNVNAFNNTYSLIHSSGVTLTAQNTIPIEFSNGSGYGIFGLFYDPSGTALPGIYYLEIDAAGNVVNTTEYNPAGTGRYVVEVADVTESLGGGDFYITGTIDPVVTGGSFWIFVLKIDQAGNIIWSTIPDIINPSTTSSRDWAKGIVESPYMPTGNQEVVVVGQTYANGGSSDAFFLRLDATSGAALASPLIYGTTSTFEVFDCIKISNNAASGGPGFIIGGTTDANGSSSNRDFWLMQTDDQGNPYWSYTYDYNGGSGNWDNSTDVIERLNQSGFYEYYLGGLTGSGNLGGTDLVVQKIDDVGNSVAEFTYGSGADDIGTSLDYFDGTGNDGLSVFGTFNGGAVGSTDAYQVQAYFNGLSGCNESFSTSSAVSAPGIITKYNIRPRISLTNVGMFATNSTANDGNLCFATSIAGGSNARLAPAEPKGDKEAIVSPNPMNQGSPVAMVELEAETPATVEIAVYDMLGKQYVSGSHTLVKGINQLPVDLSTANMAAGMYTVKITGINISKNILLIIK